MNKHLQYLKYVLRHKWFVFLYCLEYGLIWRGIKHDWSKFLPIEWTPYVEYFNGEKIPHPEGWQRMNDAGKMVPVMVSPQNVQDAFDRAWNHHEKNNSHHWQYYLLTPDNPKPLMNLQSHDGGMSHVVVATTQYASIGEGIDIALVWDGSIPGWNVAVRENEELLTQVLENTPIPLEMPLRDAQEMIADWRGAGRAVGKPDTYGWYHQNRSHIFLHPKTRAWVETELLRMERAK